MMEIKKKVKNKEALIQSFETGQAHLSSDGQHF